MASGIYREGVLTVMPEYIAYQKDGKTSTVVVLEVEQQEQDNVMVSILTNGKPDASVVFDDDEFAPDETTQALLAAIPLATQPQAKTAAVIGMGSGMTTNTLLKTDRLQVVDTIEIEEAMVEGAKYFRNFSELAFTDPRSHIHIDDAKSFFSVNNKRYDLIISEPSNPWVSGVANLFSQEFYRHIKGHLNEGGIFTQWLQVYETDISLIASVFKALSAEFNHFVIYQSAKSDLMIMASQDDGIYQLDPWIFAQPALTPYLSRLKLESTNDLYARRIATDRSLGQFFEYAFPEIQANSDFFPVLNRRSPKARFLRQDSLALLQLPYFNLPIMDFIDPIPAPGSRYNFNVNDSFLASTEQAKTQQLYELIIDAKPMTTMQYSDDINVAIRDVKLYMENCRIMDSLDGSLLQLAKLINVYLPSAKAQTFWQTLMAQECYQQLPAFSRDFLDLYQAVGTRDSQAMITSVNAILAFVNAQAAVLDKERSVYIYMAALSAYLQQDKFNEARQLAQHNHHKQGLDLSVNVLHSLINRSANTDSNTSSVNSNLNNQGTGG